MSQGRLRNRCIEIVDDEAREEGFAWMQQRYEPLKDSKWQALSIDLWFTGSGSEWAEKENDDKDS